MSGFSRAPSPVRARVSLKWAGRIVARDARRASPATTRTRFARTCESSGTRAATSRTSRFTASVTFSRNTPVRIARTSPRGDTRLASARLAPPRSPRSLRCSLIRLPLRSPRRAAGSSRFVGFLVGRRSGRYHARTMVPLLALALASLSVAALLLARRVRVLLGEVADLSARVDGLATRLAAAEDGVAFAAERAEVAETVLLEKGLADEEDLEAARSRPEGAAAGERHDGELN